ncbi:MAG: transcriptional regulator, partial [bacterium]|nr:transcriptional regulator [bacterium]
LNIATGGCDPPLRPTLRTVALEADGSPRHVVLVQVPKALYASRTQRGRWYLRVGSQKRDLTQAELSRLFQERGRTFVFDETLIPGAGYDDLDLRALEAHYHGPGNLSWEQLLLNLRILGHDGQGMARPTMAGLLGFGVDPQAHLPQAAIHAAVFRGSQRHSDDLVHSDEIGGRAQDQIDDAVAFVDRFMLKPARKDVGRQDFPQYALGAITEAIVNAVAHRDYSVSGSRIRLF